MGNLMGNLKVEKIEYVRHVTLHHLLLLNILFGIGCSAAVESFYCRVSSVITNPPHLDFVTNQDEW